MLACLILGAPAALAAPVNDHFADRTALNGSLPIEVTGTTEAATVEAGEQEDWFDTWPAGHSVWFEWTPAATEWVSVGVCNSGIPALVGIFEGPDIGSLSQGDRRLRERRAALQGPGGGVQLQGGERNGLQDRR